MKEKLLLFVPFIGKVDQRQYETAIQEFRKDYPHLRVVLECKKIDYNKQCVKIILVHIHHHNLSNVVSYTFTNTSGQQYRTLAYKSN